MGNISYIRIVDGEHIDITDTVFAKRAPAAQKVPLTQQLKAILRKHKAERCKCGHRIGFGDIAWNNGCTEYGTSYCTVEIQCVKCDREIAHIDSWYPGIEVQEELLDVLARDWGKHI